MTAPAARSSWFRRLGLRSRLMIIGVSGLVVAVSACGIALFTVLTVAVDRTLDNEAAAAISDITALINRGTPPDPLPISGAQVVQIVDASHRVVGGSVTADRLTPLLHADELARAVAGESITVPGNRAGLSGPLRVTAATAGPAGSPLTVIVAQQLSDITRSIDVLRTALLISAPLLLAILAVIAWHAIGWTLRPVEALRRGAERISGSGRAELLPVPPSNDEIAALAITLNQMLERLAAARGRQRDFVADAAHELRSPVASIRVQLEVAQRLGSIDATTAAVLTDVERLSSLVDDLLLLARADADNRPPANPTLFNGRELLTEIVTARANPGRSVEVRDGPAVEVFADRGEISPAIGNLYDNAVRHAASSVLLRVVATDEDVLFEVVDDGPGIPPADRERVFERFTRLDDSRDRDAGGSGLGLAIARELASRAGGSITLTAVDAAPPFGLRAQLRLPRSR
jgi:signal transduction histidine kinase